MANKNIYFKGITEYDANGNIIHFNRHFQGALADNLSYTYYLNGKRLQSVSDPSGDKAGVF